MKNKMRFSLLVAGIASLCNVAFAQSVEQGKKFLYYERYKSAKDVFDKLLAANPNNIDAVYWQGQTLLGMKDSVAAEELYSKALQTNGNAPLLLVGMGNIELRKGKTQDARQRFETAISLTKGKDVNVLNAIADANDDARDGDAAYGIEKLNLATQTKNFNNADTYLLMGDAYRKLIDGGNAVQAYQKALTLDPHLAEAKWKIGRIYLTQNNTEYFMQAFNEAVALDPNYAPALYELYVYYYNRNDVPKATDFLNKYIAVSDPSPAIQYDKDAMLWLDKKYDEAIAASRSAISAQGDKADLRYYKLIAYSYDSKGDSVSALDWMKQYFGKQKPGGFVPRDYSYLAQFHARFPNDSLEVIKNYQIAINMDTSMVEKLDILREAQERLKKINKGEYANLLGLAYSLNKNPTQTDLYNWGFAHYSAGNYKTADSIFCQIYESKFPEAIFGYLWCAKSALAADDSLNSQGLAVGPNIKLAEMARSLDSTARAAGSPDSIKYRSMAVNAYTFLAGYYNDNKKDKQAAIYYLEQVLIVDPSNAMALKFLPILKKPAPAPRPAGGTAKPKVAGAK